MKNKNKRAYCLICLISIVLLAVQCVPVYAETIMLNSETYELVSTSTPDIGIGLDSSEEYYVMNAKSGKLLSVKTLSDENGTEIVMRDRYDTTNRQWSITSPYTSSAMLVFVDSPTGKVLNATDTGVTLNSGIYSGPQLLCVERVDTENYEGLYTIKVLGGKYLSQATSGTGVCLVSTLNEYSYWSFMSAEKRGADIFSFSNPSYDSTANDDVFVELMDVLTYDGNAPVNGTASQAYTQLSEYDDVFIFRGHGMPGVIAFRDLENKTKSRIAVNSSVSNSSSIEHEYIDSLDDNALSKARCVMYIGCNTGVDTSNDYNLVDVTYEKGAQFVLGTTQTVHTNMSNAFLYSFLESTSRGMSVGESIEAGIIAGGLNPSYPDNRYPVYYVGDTKQYLSFTTATGVFDEE